MNNILTMVFMQIIRLYYNINDSLLHYRKIFNVLIIALFVSCSLDMRYFSSFVHRTKCFSEQVLSNSIFSCHSCHLLFLLKILLTCYIFADSNAC
jgi:hypothetical protein